MLKKLCGIAAIALSLSLAPPALAQAQKIRVGYWTSGVSLGFGATMEQMKFLEKQGLQVEWVKFSDVNGPTRAIVSGAIDVGFGASAAGALSITAEGVPVKIFLATQLAEVQFVVLENSPLKSLADLKGRKIGMSPSGSATHAIATALLEGNYGLKAGDYEAVPGNEGRLAQFLAQGEVQVAALRGTTIAQMNELKLRVLGNYGDEWKKLTKSAAQPVIGVGIVYNDFLAKHPDAVSRFVLGMKETLDYGAKNPKAVADILQKTANINAEDAAAYAAQWNASYVVSMEPGDVAMLKRMADIFRKAGAVKKDVPESAFVAEPYLKAKAQFRR